MHPKIELALLHLAAGKPVIRAARLVGLGRRTLTRHLARPEVQERLDVLKAEVREQVLARLAGELSGRPLAGVET
jgi:hypothetical protein